MCPRPAPSRCALLALSRAASPFPLFGGARRLQDMTKALLAFTGARCCSRPPVVFGEAAQIRRIPSHCGARILIQDMSMS